MSSLVTWEKLINCVVPGAEVCQLYELAGWERGQFLKEGMMGVEDCLEVS